MDSCASCGLCYQDPSIEETKYRCMRGVRDPINNLFLLLRTSCDKYVKVDLIIKTK